MKPTLLYLILIALLPGYTTAHAWQSSNIGPASVRLLTPVLIAKTYALRPGNCRWYTAKGSYYRAELISIIDSAAWFGLQGEHYHRDQLKKLHLQDLSGAGAADIKVADKLFTEAALTFCKDLYAGFNIKSWVSYDEISPKYAAADDDYIIKALLNALDTGNLHMLIASLEPKTLEYRNLKSELSTTLLNDSLCATQLRTSLNIYRWLFHFHLDRFVVVNVASATLRLYNADTVLLQMKAIVGRKNTSTPRFAAYCTGVVLYPYWNVPHSIAVNEWLPSLKRAPQYLDVIGMEVIDRYGKAVDPKKIRWSSYNKNNFPYRLRQRTGCTNPLGVVKFELTDPFTVYMHDTNFRGLFVASNRYYSHGCIRLQDPVALANALLPTPVDTAFLNACFKNQKPVVLKTVAPVPVFTVYMTAEADADNRVQYFNDVYKLLK